MLAGVLANERADVSAHETLERAQRPAEDFTVVAAEYETLARVAQQQCWDELLDRSGPGTDRLGQIHQSEAYGPLLAALRDVESRRVDVENTFPKLVAARPLSDAEDSASVMHGRVDRWAQVAGSRRRAGTNLIAGLIPRAAGVADPDMSRALAERDQAMERPDAGVGRAGSLQDEIIDHEIRRGEPMERSTGGEFTRPGENPLRIHRADAHFRGCSPLYG